MEKERKRLHGHLPIEQIFDEIYNKENWLPTHTTEDCFMKCATDVSEEMVCGGDKHHVFETEDGKLRLLSCDNCFNSDYFDDFVSLWMDTEGDELKDVLLHEQGCLLFIIKRRKK